MLTLLAGAVLIMLVSWVDSWFSAGTKGGGPVFV